MKKVIFALAAVVALAACSQEDVIVADKGAAIGFDTFVGKATRVDDPSLTNDNLKNFAVYGAVTNDDTALIFDNVEVAKTITNNDLSSEWKYKGTQYWINGATYNFAAVAPASCGKNGAFRTSPSFETILEFTNDAVTDLLYAQHEPITGVKGNGDAEGTANGMVDFTFRHVLSKIKFSFVNQYNASGSTIVVRDIVLTNPHKTATATLNATSTTWDNLATDTDFTIAFGNAVSNTATAATAVEKIAQNAELESFNQRFIIPVSPDTASYAYNVSFVVDLYYGNSRVETYTHTATVTFAPAAGTAYDIKTVINASNIDPAQSQEPIEFTVNVFDGWAAPTEQTGTINPAQNN